MIRLGLCCKFESELIAFKTTTAAAMLKLDRADRLRRLSELCRANAVALREALGYCASHQIGDFRVSSEILPLKTHPDIGYAVSDLPDAGRIIGAFTDAGTFARARGLRVTFHPDPFILLSSPDPEIIRKSVLELVYQAEVADWIGADVINIHAGGAYGNKPAALARLARTLRTLPASVRKRLTLENDDRLYSPADLLPFCRSTGVPLVYDVHHHRCLPDRLSVAEATEQALATWDREPLFHVSSPRDGTNGKNPRPHHDYIDPKDFPHAWFDLDLTVEVEAKAKEKAIARLRRTLERKGVTPFAPTGQERTFSVFVTPPSVSGVS